MLPSPTPIFSANSPRFAHWISECAPGNCKRLGSIFPASFTWTYGNAVYQIFCEHFNAQNMRTRQSNLFLEQGQPLRETIKLLKERRKKIAKSKSYGEQLVTQTNRTSEQFIFFAYQKFSKVLTPCFQVFMPCLNTGGWRGAEFCLVGSDLVWLPTAHHVARQFQAHP